MNSTGAPSDPWTGIYALAGDVRFSPSVPGTHFELPPRMDIVYSLRARTLTFYAESETDEDKWYGVGMILHLTDVEGQGLNRFSLITPNRDGGTVTFGFPLARAVPWNALALNEKASSETRDGKYVLSVERTQDSGWRVFVEPTDVSQVEPWFTEGEFRLVSSNAAPPWQEVVIDFDMKNSRSTTSGHLTLTRKH